MSFQDVAQSIINESIKSAIFIDDAISTPFSSDEDTTGLCKPLYESFQSKQCSLDFYKFDKTWESKSKLLFDRKDLLILDWEIGTTEPRYLPTLEILDQAVSTDNLHFVCIYSREGDVPDEIFYKILGFYSGLTQESAREKAQIFTEYIEDELGENSDEMYAALLPLLKELSLGKREDPRAIRKEINEVLGKQVGAIRKKINELFPKNGQYPDSDLCQLGFALHNHEKYKTLQKRIYVKCNATNNYLQINNTFFAVFKKEAQVDKLYDNFCAAIISASENFLTLMSLEIRNKVLERSSFIGKELSIVREKALFHHMENAEPDTAFGEYLIDLWKNYHTGFLYTERPKLFDVLEEYKAERPDINEIGSQDLAKLNYLYNIAPVYVNPGQNRQIGFGDVFKIGSEKNNDFLLCITPHCDCLNPQKINGFYYFVKGAKIDLDQGLALSDSGFISFLKSGEDEIICIKWALKPFTLYLCNEQRTIYTTRKIVFGEEFCDLLFLETIKENYAQRITNKAFSNPIRVGISFTRKDMDDACEKFQKRTCPHITD